MASRLTLNTFVNRGAHGGLRNCKVPVNIAAQQALYCRYEVFVCICYYLTNMLCNMAKLLQFVSFGQCDNVNKEPVLPLKWWEQTLTSASALAVQVMLSWTLAETFPMMQGSLRWAAHTLVVVGKTGGTGRITGCEAQRVNVNGFLLAWQNALRSI